MYLVSVIIPIYNVEKYIKECLDSVVNQSLKEIEIICVEDGSTDRSEEIVKEYAHKYSNITIIKQNNKGVSCARNVGIKNATGEYIYFLDSDDYIEWNTLEILYDVAKNKQLDLLYFNAESIFENETVRSEYKNYVNRYLRKNNYTEICTGQSMFKKMIKNKEYFSVVYLMLIKNSFLKENNIMFYENIIHEDNLFTFQCTMLASKVGYCEKSFYRRRLHNNSIMTNKCSMKNVEGYVVNYAEMVAFLSCIKVEPKVTHYIKEYLYKYIYRTAYNLYKQLECADKESYIIQANCGAKEFLYLIKKEKSLEVKGKKIRLLLHKLDMYNLKLAKLQRKYIVE